MTRRRHLREFGRALARARNRRARPTAPADGRPSPASERAGAVMSRLGERVGGLASQAVGDVRDAAGDLRPTTSNIRVGSRGVRIAGSRRGRLRPYGLAFDRLLVRLDAEQAHHLGFGAIRLSDRIPGGRSALRRSFVVEDPALRVHALGLDFPGPLGLAAGFDKDALGVEALASMGFGFIEIGTVTARPQPGNPRPRLARLPADRALVNRMGFNNAGAAAAAARLAALRRGPGADVVIGVNIGKSRDAPDDEAEADYAESARLLGGLADYLVVNVSSPNTPGLRDLQSTVRLRPILTAVRAAADEVAGRHVPLLVKIAPDLADQDVLAVADLALEIGLDGIVATNTTVSRRHLRSRPGEVSAAGSGGLSGRPLAARSLAVLRLLRGRVGDRLVLVSVGGITTPDEAWARLRAGATLIQAYSAFVYEGPSWARRIHRGLLQRAHHAGYARVQDVVGADDRRSRERRSAVVGTWAREVAAARETRRRRPEPGQPAGDEQPRQGRGATESGTP